MEEKQKQLEQSGYAFTPVWGGQPTKTYYTPDGRTIKAIPGWREYVKKDSEGHVIETGTRDANYDKGWLETPPTELKLYCRYCDKWHDTEQEIEDCSIKHKKLETWGMRQARKLHPKDFEAYDKMQGFEDRLNKQDEKLDKILKAIEK